MGAGPSNTRETELRREPQAFSRRLASILGSQRTVREARSAAVSGRATAEIGAMTDREIFIAGAVAYWCEGAKSKPHRHVERVAFINSDRALIGFFLRFLDTAGIQRDDLIFRMYIHETADVEAAHRFWLDLTGAQPSQFRRPVLKRHNPNRKIEGWAAAAMSGPVLSAGSA